LKVVEMVCPRERAGFERSVEHVPTRSAKLWP
jgi:hypothetical protein